MLIDLREAETTLDFGDLLKVTLEFAYYKDCFRNKISGVIPNDPERIKRGEFFKTGMGAVSTVMPVRLAWWK